MMIYVTVYMIDHSFVSLCASMDQLFVSVLYTLLFVPRKGPNETCFVYIERVMNDFELIVTFSNILCFNLEKLPSFCLYIANF